MPKLASGRGKWKCGVSINAHRSKTRGDHATELTRLDLFGRTVPRFLESQNTEL
jgi:hypothetical protein